MHGFEKYKAHRVRVSDLWTTLIGRIVLFHLPIKKVYTTLLEHSDQAILLEASPILLKQFQASATPDRFGVQPITLSPYYLVWLLFPASWKVRINFPAINS